MYSSLLSCSLGLILYFVTLVFLVPWAPALVPVFRRSSTSVWLDIVIFKYKIIGYNTIAWVLPSESFLSSKGSSIPFYLWMEYGQKFGFTRRLQVISVLFCYCLWPCVFYSFEFFFYHIIPRLRCCFLFSLLFSSSSSLHPVVLFTCICHF